MNFVIFNIAANLKTYNNTWIVVSPNTSYKLLNIQFDDIGIIRSIVFSVNNNIVAFERSNTTGKFSSNFALSAWHFIINSHCYIQDENDDHQTFWSRTQGSIIPFCYGQLWCSAQSKQTCYWTRTTLLSQWTGKSQANQDSKTILTFIKILSLF